MGAAVVCKCHRQRLNEIAFDLLAFGNHQSQTLRQLFSPVELATRSEIPVLSSWVISPRHQRQRSHSRHYEDSFAWESRP